MHKKERKEERETNLRRKIYAEAYVLIAMGDHESTLWQSFSAQNPLSKSKQKEEGRPNQDRSNTFAS